jgi:hypothetical protein
VINLNCLLRPPPIHFDNGLRHLYHCSIGGFFVRSNTTAYSIRPSIAGGLSISFSNKTLFLPNSGETSKIVEKVRAEFLEKGEISNETVALSALLYKSGLIKNYFSKYEVNKLKERLEEIKKSEAGSLVKEMVDYIEKFAM